MSSRQRVLFFFMQFLPIFFLTFLVLVFFFSKNHAWKSDNKDIANWINNQEYGKIEEWKEKWTIRIQMMRTIKRLNLAMDFVFTEILSKNWILNGKWIFVIFFSSKKRFFLLNISRWKRNCTLVLIIPLLNSLFLHICICLTTIFIKE